MKIKMMATGKVFDVTEVGTSSPFPLAVDELTVGDVGFLAASIKSVGDTRVADTITTADKPAKEALPGYRKINPMVFCGLYPVDTSEYINARTHILMHFQLRFLNKLQFLYIREETQ